MLHRPLVAALALALALPAAAGARDGSWHRPLPAGEVVGAFAFDAAAPYARGQRRGLDLRAAPGAPVLAPCPGRVTYAGRIPGTPARGLGVSVRCGPLVATLLGLGAVAVRSGRTVAAGRPVGRLGPDGVLRLGARRAVARHGYVDPAKFLSGGGEGPPPVAPVAWPHARGRFVPPPARPAPVAVAPAPVFAPPVLAWVGLALVAGGGAGGAARAHGRRARTRPKAAAAGR